MIYVAFPAPHAYSFLVADPHNLSLFPNTVAQVVAGLRSIGYHGALLEENYKFPDWFSHGEEWSVAAAAFGQTPVSYDSACIGVVQSNGLREQSLINRCRALGAPIMLEVAATEIREWNVSRKENSHGLVEAYRVDRIADMLASRAADWRPQNLLRLKNIGSYQWHQQLGLFAGLLPELEEHIQENLDPLLRETLSQVRRSYFDSTGREPNASQTFKLIFWMLTAKVFYDRQVSGFSKLSGDSEELLKAVAKHYRDEVPRLLTREARQIAADRIWKEFDFRNLSVEVLAQIWSSTLVDDETKRKLSIHRTSRTIVRYIVERIPFNSSGDDKRIILEPCSGSAVFLLGTMNVLRPRLFAMDAAERHKYFVDHLAAIEADPFAVEISKLALTLADFPNPNGWDVAPGDVFDSSISADYLKRAALVLCNPPYSDFDLDERAHYGLPYVQRPAAILDQVLNHLHPEGVLGFVLPRVFVDGRGAYAEVRKRIAERFASIEITLLPDRAFPDADAEIAILIATDPIPHKGCRVINRKVNDGASPWADFEESHKVSSEYSAEFPVDAVERSLVVPELPEVWDFLVSYPTLDDVAEVYRGIEWNIPLIENGRETGNRSLLVKDRPTEGFRKGIAPQTDFKIFERPATAYLDFRPEMQKGGPWRHAWDKPKAIVNKAARSRGHWRMAAFPDSDGLACYQTYFGVWPKSDSLDEWSLSAILNSPVANAFVATREGKTDITKETLLLIPVPQFTEAQRIKLRELIKEYQKFTSTPPLEGGQGDAESLLKQIDATVLSGYRMPPRIERQLLDFFRDQERPTRHSFSDYFPKDFSAYFSLADYLSPDFASATVGELLRRTRETSHT
ncbi:MAG TPA: N-6 DNA methylase [Terriglobales bacterium]|nr:N-6 DNA methylase [Terriglobales bacterium]